MRYSYRNTFPGVVRHPARVRAHVHLPAAIRCQHHEPVARLARNCDSIRNGRCHELGQPVRTLAPHLPGATLADKFSAGPRVAPAAPVAAAANVSANGGNIGRDDLTTYRAIVRNCSHNRNVTPSATGLASCMRNAPGIVRHRGRFWPGFLSPDPYITKSSSPAVIWEGVSWPGPVEGVVPPAVLVGSTTLATRWRA